MDSLYNMVRILAGTLMAVGIGPRREPQRKCQRCCSLRPGGSRSTAPAKGLMLAGMEYQVKSFVGSIDKL